MTDWLLSAQRYVIAAAVVLTGCVFLPALADPVNVVKLTLLMIAGLVVLFLSVLRLLRDRVLPLPHSAGAAAAAALAGAFLVAAAVAPNKTTAVVGTYGRNSGLIAYAAALALFFVGVRAWTAATAHVLVLALLLSGLFTASYGLLQYVGVDAIHWNNPFNPIIASLGNPDFASAYLGMCAPAAAWGAFWTSWAKPWRVASGIVTLMCLAAAVLSYAVQGPVAAFAGLAVFGAALVLERGGRSARRGLLALASIAALGFAVLLLGAAQLGPAAFVFRRSSFHARRVYWDGALAMFRRHPLTGVGLDHYGAYWRQIRSDEATQFLGGTSFTDAAHSVPLQMMAQGGLVLGLAYLAFLLCISVALVRGLLRLEGSARLILGALGGTWAAYVLSSAVSIDQVPLLTVEFVVAGAIVGISVNAWKEVRLPGALVEPAGQDQRRRQPVAVRSRALNGLDWAIAGTVGLLLLVGMWVGLRPFRANAALHTGDASLAQGKGDPALAAYVKSTRLLPGAGIYWGKLGALWEAVHHQPQALQAYDDGSRHDAFDVAVLLNRARLAQTAGATADAAAAFHRALWLDPTNPATVEQAAAFEAAHGEAPAAARALSRASRANPRDVQLALSLGMATERAGDPAAARAAYERALTLQPNQPEAVSALKKLSR